MSSRKWLVRFTGFVIIFTLFVILIITGLEVLFRFNPNYGRVGFQFDRQLIWRLNPNLAAQKPYAQGQVQGKDPFALRFNNRGFRGKKMRKRKKEGITRIMILGDSYTAGLDYPDDEIFTSYIEQKLNQEYSNYEVQNVSSPAWGSDQHYVYWNTEGIEYNPDYLVIMMSPNDMREMFNKKLATLEGASINYKKARLPTKERWGWYLASTSSFFQYLQKNVLKTNYGEFAKIFHYYPVNYGKKDATDWDAPIYLKDPFQEVDQTYVLFETMLNDITASCKKIGTKLLLVKIPIKSEFDGSYETEEHDPNKITEMIAQIAARNNIPFLNLNEELKKDPDPLRIFMHWEYHFNKAGHDYVGEAVTKFLEDQME